MEDFLFTTEKLVFANNIFYNDLNIPKGKISFIVGASGSGKSSLLKMFNHSLNKTSGKIFYCGKMLEEFDPIQLRREISLISQEVFLFSGTIENNFEKFYYYREQSLPSLEDLQYFLDLCAVVQPFSYDVAMMSGGERQRLYLAIFLSFNPQVILLDEPTASLDSSTANKVLQNIIKHSKKKSCELIIISHDENLRTKFAEYTITIDSKNKYEGKAS